MSLLVKLFYCLPALQYVEWIASDIALRSQKNLLTTLYTYVRDPDGTKKYGESLQDKSVTTLSDLLELAGKDGRSPIISLTS